MRRDPEPSLNAEANAEANADNRAAERDPYLTHLGERIRSLRAARGMSRKDLARGAGVSERYLANLETGTGNASVLLLRHVAGALDVPLPVVLAEVDGHAAPAGGTEQPGSQRAAEFSQTTASTLGRRGACSKYGATTHPAWAASRPKTRRANSLFLVEDRSSRASNKGAKTLGA